ncbi:MAG TPA: HAMP domain-containing sensor histidine kinase [Actinomycetota bacterium]|nr:HAMP domain-containing sensor histidine kinase [Actinomycetota bacterium]
MRRVVPAGQFRRRLTIAFVLVAGVAAGTVGLGAYLLVRDVRSDDFVERSTADAEANWLTVQEQAVPLDDAGVRPLVARLERRAADATVVVDGDQVYSSAPEIDVSDVPDGLAAPARHEEGEALPHEDVTIGQHEYLVVATPLRDAGSAMYFFYSKTSMLDGLRDLARITWRLWLLVVVAAALVGNALARRTLRPVSRASLAAQSLAEGLLATRLPVESEDEFGAWAVSFNEMAEALETKISELVATRDRERQFTSDVSHELRTPMTALVSSASMLEARLADMDADTRWMAEQMIREARRLRALVDDLLEISRLHSSREVLRLSEVDLGRLVANVITNQHWEDAVDFDGQSVVVHTDKARVERIVVNLIGNAVEHGRESTRVTVAQNGGSAEVEVSDSGRGIPAADLPHVFERFYKADPSRPGGSGLGLAIAAEHARLLGGSISVSSTEGRGATFTLRVPDRAPDEEAQFDGARPHARDALVADTRDPGPPPHA